VPSALRSSGISAPDKVHTGVTSREGAVKLDTLSAGPWDVTVKARGLVPRTVRRVGSAPLAVRLEKGASVTGVVRDGSTNQVVAGARVAVESGQLSGWSDDRTRDEILTDSRGRFRLDGIGRGAVTIAARALGFARAERTGVRPGAAVELFLFPGASLAGSVKDDEGRPVVGATVRAESDQLGGSPLAERTDAKGEFRMPSVRAAEYAVVAREGSRAPGIAVAVVEPEGEATVSLTLSEGGYATGRIVDADRRPLAGGVVRVDALGDRTLPDFASEMLSAEAKADGTFAVGPLPLGSLRLAASAPRHASRQVQVDIPARRHTADVGDVVLEVGLAIRGRLRERAGKPVAGAAVQALREGPGGPSEAEATSEEDGTFLMAGLGTGRHTVSASAEGYVTASSSAEPGGDPLELVLDPGSRIEGRIVDADGAPVEEAIVFAEETGSARKGRLFHARADEGEGAFAIRDIGAGTYSLEANAQSRGQATLAGVRVAPGRIVDVGRIALARGGVVRGVVVDGEGVGIPGATVGARVDANRWRSGQPQTQSGSGGAFELRGVPIGPVRVNAMHPAYAPGREAMTTVDGETDPAPMRLVLLRGGRLEGRALYRDGRGFSGGRVNYYSLEAEGARSGVEMAPIEDNGAFVVDHVPPGRGVVSLMAFTPSSPMMSGPMDNILTSVASREVDVQDGETTTLELLLRDVVMEGRVTRGGEPEPGAFVSVMPLSTGVSAMSWVGPRAARVLQGGPPPLAATTRDDGRYALLVFTPGPAYVELRGRGQSHSSRQVEIPDADRFELDLSLGAADVSGIVVDPESGSPVPEASIRLRRTDGREGGGGAESGNDGRFVLGAEPGDYTLDAVAADRAPASQPLSVGAAGVSDVRVELEPGRELRGRIIDVSGRPAAGYQVIAMLSEGAGTSSRNSGVDGSFRIGGLAPKPYTVVAGSELVGYAIRSSVLPGGEPLELTLRPGGRVVLRVVDARDQPVRDAYPIVEGVDGTRVRLPGRTAGTTDASGSYTLASPSGLVEVVARTEKGIARGNVSVPAGGSVPLTLVLRPNPGKSSQ